MIISDLSTTESRQLLLIHTKLQYDRQDSVESMVRLIGSKGYFKSEAGEVYTNGLKNLLAGRIPIDCIYCGTHLGRKHNLICKSCSDELYERVNSENKELQRDRYEYDKAKSAAAEIGGQRAKIGYSSAADYMAAADAKELYEYAQQSLDRITSQESITESDAGAISGASSVEGGLDISSNSDSPDRRKQENNQPEKSKNIHQIILAVAISVAIAALMTSMILLRYIGVSNGGSFKNIFSGGSKQDIETTADAEGSYIISKLGNKKLEDIRKSKQGSYLTDGFELLGEKYTEIDDEYGEFQQILSNNTRYYPECGVSLVFSEDSERVIYIENDGSGTGDKKVPILGILPGDSTLKARTTLSDNGLEALEIGDNSYACQFGEDVDGRAVYELNINYERDVIKLISIRML